VRRTAETIAASAGATARVEITRGYPITFNDPQLTERMVPTLRRVAGDVNVHLGYASLGAEDFAFFEEKTPGLFFWLGTRPKNQTADEAPANHSPLFYIDESGLALGVRAMTNLALDSLATTPSSG
ncbi:MAG TPA: M20/M25/M40 family metallo-hydrolase, partial [Thermoanaerobaculia bacterium]|nr:M20/M25/M40 family metallo-hydrolase [Thermoanaerobaculia bacterium]